MHRMVVISLLALAGALAMWSISRPAEVPFEKVLIDGGASETCAFADVNGDGKLDIVSGEYWYEAPRWTPGARIQLASADFDGDGALDFAAPGKTGLYLFHNLGKRK
jgi:hypothetical protein